MRQASDFDWANSGSVVVRPVQAVAVYSSREGDVVIRQQRSFGAERDEVVTIPQAALAGFIQRLQNIRTETYVDVPYEDVPEMDVPLDIMSDDG